MNLGSYSASKNSLRILRMCLLLNVFSKWVALKFKCSLLKAHKYLWYLTERQPTPAYTSLGAISLDRRYTKHSSGSPNYFLIHSAIAFWPSRSLPIGTWSLPESLRNSIVKNRLIALKKVLPITSFLVNLVRSSGDRVGNFFSSL